MVDPVTTYLGSTALERAADLFGKKVIGRWADYRARRFIEQFVEAVAAEDKRSAEEADVDQRLTDIVADERKAAALFDAFRRVCFSASREIGPRVLALHMAEVVAGRVDDEEVSDAVMTAAANLLDFEFEEMLSFAASKGVEGASFAESLEEVAVVITETVDFDSNWKGSRKAMGFLPLRMEMGSWALKLEQVGLLVQELSEEEFDYKEDSEAHIDEPGTVRRVHRNVELREGTSYLVRLTRRAMRGRDSS